MVKIGLTERAIVLRVDVSSDSLTDTSFFKLKEAIELRDTIGRRRSGKIKRPRSGAAFYLISGGISRRNRGKIL